MRRKCEHGRLFTYCVPCKGAMICRECGRRRDRCVHHMGTEMCARHCRRKQRCFECYPALATAQRIRDQCRRVVHALRRAKTESSSAMLGCDAAHLREVFEQKMAWWNARFEPAMAWDSFDLDHIKPVHTLLELLRSGASEDEVRALQQAITHHTNMQPLPPRVNQIKRSAWSPADEARWQHLRTDDAFREVYLPASVWARVQCKA